jgi:predicted amidophosphoribosyltransferase
MGICPYCRAYDPRLLGRYCERCGRDLLSPAVAKLHAAVTPANSDVRENQSMKDAMKGTA